MGAFSPIITVSLKETDQEAYNIITNAILQHLRKPFNILAKKLETQFKIVIRKAIEKEDEYQELISGPTLRAELGLDRAAERVNRIVDVFIDNIYANPIPLYKSGRSIRGEIEIVLLRGDYKEILEDDEATIIPKRSAPFNWVEWLLLKGDEETIIEDYEVEYGEHGRSGMAIMVKNEGRKWRVPPEFAGNAENNWLTRAINNASTEINTLMSQGLADTI